MESRSGDIGPAMFSVSEDWFHCLRCSTVPGMEHFGTIHGHGIGISELEEIRSLLQERNDWNRSRLSVELCRRWGLRRANGGLADMACRHLLLKLHRRGLIVLPPRRRPDPNGHRNRRIAFVAHECAPVRCALAELAPLSVGVAARGTYEERLFNCLLSRYHYLGLRSTVGENLKYLVRARDGRALGCLLFGAAAWRIEARDRFIGWSRATRERNLQHITDNTRFLILPWVRVRFLASRVLSLVARRIRGDWQAKYGHPVELLETFVDTSRFRGTCYRAANWCELGLTTGRTRNSVSSRPQAPPKAVFVYPLHSAFRRELCR